MNWPARVLIVDDEKPARARLTTLLARRTATQVVAECSGGQEALEFAVSAAESGAPVDIVFLDVQMPEMDGFALLEALYAALDSLPIVVFATAYDAYALKAFDAHAVDYLLKPFSDERFEIALARAIRLARSGASASVVEQMQALLRDIAAPISGPEIETAGGDYLDRLALKERGRVRLINVNEVMWIEATGVYVTIHTAKDSFLHREVLARLAEKLDPRRFVRIHRGYIVNFEFVHELLRDAHGDFVVSIKDAAPLKVGRMYRPRLEERLRQRL